jgi:D-3-phosphoglycerate dehydrogenase
LEKIIVFLEYPDIDQKDLSFEISNYLDISICYPQDIPNLKKEQKYCVVGIFTKLSKLVTDELLQEFPNLQVIGTPTTGTDHIQIQEASLEKIKLVTLKHFPKVISTFSSTVEIVWWHIIELTRFCSKYQDSIGQGIWNRYQYETVSLKNKTIGIVGLGRLGKKVAKVAESFDLKVIFFEIDSRSINEGISLGYKYNSLEEIFSKAHIISINIDDRKSNYQLINNSLLSNIRENKPYLVNTSRGFVLNETDILDGLRRGKLSGFGTDVIESEHKFTDSVILETSSIWTAKFKEHLPITITPHIGGATKDSMSISSLLILRKMFNMISV